MAPQKTVLITGANGGIGFQLATRFQERGYVVYGSYRSKSKTDPSVADLRAKGVKTLEIDLDDERSIHRAVAEFGDRGLDVLINCAGLYFKRDDKPWTDDSAGDLIEHFKVNVVAPFTVAKAFLPALSRASLGKIINVSSDFASMADNTGGNVSYRISKAGINQLTKTMAVDFDKLGNKTIRTLAVHPGYLPTKMTGFYGPDDMETCMGSLVGVIERFGTDEGKDIPNGGYVRWNGEVMAY